jgi:dTDP-4-dehydrorhamnose 3,5-epimerase
VIFAETSLRGAFIIAVEPHEDERGAFARTFCAQEFAAHGLSAEIAQMNIAFNRLSGTVRGMHVQVPPMAETKLVRCTRGAVLDVIVDLRPESATYLEHIAVELTADNHRALYVPERFAHGYQVLVDGSEVGYQVGANYSPAHERVIRYDDPRIGVSWPLPVRLSSGKDRAAPLLETWAAGLEREMAVAE